MVGSVSADSVIGGRIQPPAIIGKLPGHGDFLARGVDYGLRESLDMWMSEWIELARKDLADRFEAAYESAAPWLFEGSSSNAVFMPSVDAVGRWFPILAVCSANVRIQDIYDTLIAALESAAKADALHEQLGALSGDVSEDARNESGDWFLPDGAEPTLPSPSDVPSWSEMREHFA